MSISKLGRPNWKLVVDDPLLQETKDKIRASLKGRLSPNVGRKHSDESKRNMSLAHKGSKQSEETRRKRSLSLMGHKAWNKGLRVSEDFIRKTGNKGKITKINMGIDPQEKV